jgi:iron complex outermembrane receptor protein
VYSIYANADTVRKGMELDIVGYIGTPKLNYALTYSYQRSGNDADDDSMPHHIASLRLGYRLMPLQFNVMLRHVSEYDSNQFAVGNQYYEIGDFSRVDANISYDFKVADAQMRATLFGQNLTDEEYQTRLGWKDVGMTYGVELGVTF